MGLSKVERQEHAKENAQKKSGEKVGRFCKQAWENKRAKNPCLLRKKTI